jgi:S-adenosylmethionine/arginine decarboxylase-like enzyme
VPERFSHLFADFVDVPRAPLDDTALISGLLIAAAGAAGFSPIGAPVVRSLPSGGVTGLLLLDGCHVAVHTFPHLALLLLDVLSPESQDPRKALDVFARRLPAREIRSDVRTRG